LTVFWRVEMTDLEVLMHKFIAEKGKSFDEVQMCWQPAMEAFIKYASGASVGEKITDSKYLHGKRDPQYVATEKCIFPQAGIVCKDGKFHVKVQIQDGIEDCGTYHGEQKAKEAWVQGMNVMNHAEVEVKDAPETIYLDTVYRVR